MQKSILPLVGLLRFPRRLIHSLLTLLFPESSTFKKVDTKSKSVIGANSDTEIAKAWYSSSTSAEIYYYQGSN